MKKGISFICSHKGCKSRFSLSGFEVLAFPRDAGTVRFNIYCSKHEKPFGEIGLTIGEKFAPKKKTKKSKIDTL